MEQSASVVGNRFVLKYYTVLNQKPTSLHQFYKANSSFTFGLEDESNTTPEDAVIGSENIGKKIDSLDFHDCKVSLAVVDCQDSLNGGVLVTVIGYLSNKGETPRKFVQTFFLAVQTEPQGYFVLNSVFRYLKDPTVFPQPNIKTPAVQQSPQVQQPLQQVAEVQQSTKEPEKPAHVTPAPQPAQTPAPAPAPAKVEPTKAESKPETNHKVEHKKQPEPTPAPAPATQAPTQTQDAPKTQKHTQKQNDKSEAHGHQNHKEQRPKGKEKEKEKEQAAEKKSAPQPGTWAAMVTNNQEKAPKPTSAPKVQSPQPPAKTTQAPAKPADKPAEKEVKEVKEKDGKETGKPYKEKEGKEKIHPGFTPLKEELTVFVSNVPFQATEEQVRACFSKAGDIKSVVLRASSGYSFVEFGSEEILQKALQFHKASPFVMEGRHLSLEEKKPNWDKIEKKEFKKDFGFKKEKKPFKKEGANGKTDKPKKEKPFLKEEISSPAQ